MKDSMTEEDEIVFKKGQMLKIDGIPFFLEEDTTLRGNKQNIDLIDVSSRDNVKYVNSEKRKGKGLIKKIVDKFK